MKVIVNGEPREHASATLAELWRAETGEAAGEPRRGFAIALNGVVVPHAEWQETPVRDNDRIEIIRAIQGG